MKKVLNYLMMGAVAATLMTTSSCTKSCDPGYEGSDCKTEIRAKIIGKYRVVESCDTSGAADYYVDITKATDVQQVYVSPFGGYTGYTATVKFENGNLTLQSTTPSTGYVFSNFVATTTTGATIATTYKIAASNASENCTGTWTKQ